MTVLEKINSPADLKRLSMAELTVLAEEMRAALIRKVDTTGGHMGPNLGMIEATIALHYVFDAPSDKIVFDVSHQSYPHKMLTGRREAFTNPEKYGSVSGYTNPAESPYDLFTIGHTATSVSLACGLAKARDLQGGRENVIAVIGDGSLSGGEAYEGLNNAAVLGSNMIIVVNDNDMSIAANHGGLYHNLKLLRETNGQADCNFFKAMGFDYRYIDDGHDLENLIAVFRSVQNINHPVVVHMHTIKGKGLAVAERSKEQFHWIVPGGVEAAESGQVPVMSEDYNSITRDFLTRKYREDHRVVVISPATPGATGLTPAFREQAGIHYADVGIAEEHAVAFSSGIAAGGGKPVMMVLSSFIQRAYDQLSQDLALNQNPATILVFWGGLSDADATHLGAFDIPMISNIPNMVYLAPTTKEEYLAMLNWSMTQTEHPVAIRVPFGGVVSSGKPDTTDYGLLNRFKVMEKGKDVAILGLGNFFGLAHTVCQRLADEAGIRATLINPVYMTGLDRDLLNELKADHQLVVTLEDGQLDGGFGEKVARFYGHSDMKVLTFGGRKEFTDRMPELVLYERNHLTPEQIVSDIKSVLKRG